MEQLQELKKEVADAHIAVDVCKRDIEMKQVHLKKLEEQKRVKDIEFKKLRSTLLQQKIDTWINNHRDETNKLLTRITMSHIKQINPFPLTSDNIYGIECLHDNDRKSKIYWVCGRTNVVKYSILNEEFKYCGQTIKFLCLKWLDRPMN